MWYPVLPRITLPRALRGWFNACKAAWATSVSKFRFTGLAFPDLPWISSKKFSRNKLWGNYLGSKAYGRWNLLPFGLSWLKWNDSSSYPLFLPAMFSFYPNPTTSPSRIINKLPGNHFTVEEQNRSTAANEEHRAQRMRGFLVISFNFVFITFISRQIRKRSERKAVSSKIRPANSLVIYIVNQWFSFTVA